MAGEVKTSNNLPKGMERLKGEHLKVVQDCKSQIAHWTKVENDYRTLQERLSTLPDTLSYDVMVPFGPLAFMPGKLVHTNELTVLLGDNWFAKCSAKQAQTLVEHRKRHVESKLDDLQEVAQNLQNRAGFTEAVEKMTDGRGAFVDIREDAESEEAATKGKHRVAHKPNSKPKKEFKVHLEEEEEEEMMEEEEENNKGILSEEELWARLDELEHLEEEQDKKDRTDNNREETTSSSSEDEKEEDAGAVQVNGPELLGPRPEYEEEIKEYKMEEEEMEEEKDEEEMEEEEKDEEEMEEEEEKKDEEEEEEKDEEEEEGQDGLPTIYFSHTVELKKVRINTGKNTTLKFSERKEQKEQAKRKKKNGKSNGHEHHKILTPSDIYRVFVDVVNGEPVPRKSILKSRSRENSVCSESSESSATDFEERRVFLGRSFSHDEAAHSDTSAEEDSPTGTSFHPNGRFQAFSGTVVEKDPLPSLIPHLTISPPALPTIPERKQEESGFEVPQEPPRRLSKFKAARQQK